MDKSHVRSRPGEASATRPRSGDGRTLYIHRPEDAGASATRSAGRWTLELARALCTGHPDDADLTGAEEVPVPFAVAILDRAEDDDHATSEVQRLRLAKRR